MLCKEGPDLSDVVQCKPARLSNFCNVVFESFAMWYLYLTSADCHTCKPFRQMMYILCIAYASRTHLWDMQVLQVCLQEPRKQSFLTLAKQKTLSSWLILQYFSFQIQILSIPKRHNITFTDIAFHRHFTLNVPSWWNDLPNSIREAVLSHLQESA